MLEPLLIHSGQGEYRVEFTQGGVAELAARLAEMNFSGLVIDRRVAGLYADALAPLLVKVPVLLADATEEEKTLTGAAKVLDFMQANNFSRQSRLLAVGGGIIEDLSSFAAHVYYRGIRWEFVPTTLLAMSDSCIGAKCCLNFSRHKNQIGAFHAPSAVWIATAFLGTLSDSDVRSGYGEIVKLALTAPGGLFAEVRDALERGGLRNPQLPGLIRAALRVKQEIIEKDEYEADLRRILNYGHTFGHVLETLSGYEVPHGLAVAWGMDLANWIACRKGLLAPADFAEVHEFLVRHFSGEVRRLPDAAELLQGAKRDKKAAAGTISLILPEKPGTLAIVPTALDGELAAAVADYLQRWSFIRNPAG
jgi:3-dehydroquinate synthase